MNADLGTSVTVRGMPFDEKIVRSARECGDVLVQAASSPCHIGFQIVKRLGSQPEIEVTISLEVHGALVWAITSDEDWSSALQVAFLRVADRVANALDWGGSVDMRWRRTHRAEQAS